MIVPVPSVVTDVALLLLRLLIAALFGSSGWSHLTKPEERGESIGLSPAMTLAVGAAEVAGALSVALGLFPQLGALLLMGVMVGAIQKKAFVWKTGFWGDEGNGWYYDLLYLVCNLVIFATGGGAIGLT